MKNRVEVITRALYNRMWVAETLDDIKLGDMFVVEITEEGARISQDKSNRRRQPRLSTTVETDTLPDSKVT